MAEDEKPVMPQPADSAVRPAHPTWTQWSRGRLRHGLDSDRVPAWLRPTGPENRLPVAAAILVAIALQIGLSDRYGLHPRWLLPALEVALLAVLTAINPVRLSRRTRVGRYLTMALAGAITLDNLVSAFVLDYSIVTGKTGNDAIGLLSAGAAIYLTNIIVFGIWYWELDRGGPFSRAAATVPHPDFLFPQMVSPEISPEHWEATFPRLPLHQLHQRHGVLADRHHAAVTVGEVTDGAAERHRPVDHGTCPCQGGQHLEVSHRWAPRGGQGLLGR
jgi:hypothetical protein